MNVYITKLDKFCKNAAPVWLLLSFFIPFFKQYWYVFVMMLTFHYVVNKQWKALGIVLGFYAIIMTLRYFLPMWALKLVYLGIVIWMFITYYKAVKNDESNIMIEAQAWAAKAQLAICKKAIKGGYEIDKEFIQELESTINRTKRTPTETRTVDGTIIRNGK